MLERVQVIRAEVRLHSLFPTTKLGHKKGIMWHVGSPATGTLIPVDDNLVVITHDN